MKIGAIIQARTASTRMPAKVLQPLPLGSDTTVLDQVINRVQNVQSVHQVILATTTDQDDQILEKTAQRHQIDCFLGSEQDVLSRFFHAAWHHDLQHIVRITSDCPCIDPSIIDLVIEKHLQTESDFTTNCLSRSFVHGMDTEVLTFSSLTRAYENATRPYERQHVCPYIYKTAPESFRITRVMAPEELHAPDIRATLDTPEDYALLCAIYDDLYKLFPAFNSQQLIALIRAKPWLQWFNSRVSHKQVLGSLEEELEEAFRVMRRQELHTAADHLQKLIGTITRHHNPSYVHR